MIIVYTRHGETIEVPHGAAVTAGSFPAMPGNTPAAAFVIVDPSGRHLAMFRAAETAGVDLSAAGADD